MSLQNWGDLFKYNKELLEDDFNHGQALVIKTKTVAADKTVSSISPLPGFLMHFTDISGGCVSFE